MKVYVGVELDREEARHLAELLNQEAEEVDQESPKLVIGDEEHLLLPGVFTVEHEADLQGKLILEGEILLRDKRFRIEIL